MAGGRGTNTQAIDIVTTDVTVYEERRVGTLVQSWSIHLRQNDVKMESSLFGGWENTQANKRWEQSGRHSQIYSWGLRGVRAVHRQ